MKKVFSLLGLMFAVIFIVNAQAPKGMGSSDPEAKKVLDAVSAKFKTYKSVQAKFSLKIENASGSLLPIPFGAWAFTMKITANINPSKLKTFFIIIIS